MVRLVAHPRSAAVHGPVNRKRGVPPRFATVVCPSSVRRLVLPLRQEAFVSQLVNLMFALPQDPTRFTAHQVAVERLGSCWNASPHLAYCYQTPTRRSRSHHQLQTVQGQTGELPSAPLDAGTVQSSQLVPQASHCPCQRCQHPTNSFMKHLWPTRALISLTKNKQEFSSLLISTRSPSNTLSGDGKETRRPSDN